MKLSLKILFLLFNTHLLFPYSSFVYMPWRQQYVSTSHAPLINDCALCEKCASTSEAEFVLARTNYFIIALNKFPYTKGHLLIVPYAHVGELHELAHEALQEIMVLAHECCLILKKAFNCDGFNVGLNIKKAAGASIVQHLHMHVVPRYESNVHSFLQAICDTGEMPWNLNTLYQELKPLFAHVHKNI